MKKLLPLFFFLMILSGVIAQVRLDSLITNPQLFNSEFAQKSGSNCDNFTYLYDSLDLPVVDDFSSNKFLPKATEADSNLFNTTFYQYEIGGSILASDIYFVTDTTYVYQFEIAGTDTIYDTIAKPDYTVTEYNICEYPLPIPATFQGWDAFHTYDTIINGNLINSTNDTLFNRVKIQDSIIRYFVQPTPATLADVWTDQFVFLNSSIPINPPSIGVATFDGLDETGYPYNFSDASSYGQADFLTSKPILLDLPSTDSIYLSFYYQPQGLGNRPEDGDSLVLEFYAPDDDEWNWIWSKEGSVVDDFKQIMISITDPKYLKDGFRFRFKNYATLSGNFDHWNLDYVYLDKNRNINDTSISDIAFVQFPPSLINQYEAMPWLHYTSNPPNYMNVSGTMNMEVKNNHSVGTTLNDIDNDLNIVYKGSIINNFTASSKSITAFSSEILDYNYTGFQFDSLINDTSAEFTIDCIFRDPNFFISSNDTVSFRQIFQNYYAYDDGSAEAAYQLIGNQASLAYEFDIPVGDTLKAIQIHFSPSMNDASNLTFALKIWTDLNQNPIFINTPKSPTYDYTSPNGFTTYLLDSGVYVNNTIYVGWTQLFSSPQTPNSLNTGFDLNNNQQNKIFYKTSSGSWKTDSPEGALMIRPVFPSNRSYILNKEENSVPEWNIYPNPARGTINFSSLEQPSQISLFNLTGQMIYNNQNPASQERINISNLTPGVYQIIVFAQNGIKQSKKVVIF